MRKRNEGNEEQRQAASRQARRADKSPSAEGISIGASKQERHAKGSADYREKLESRDKGRQPSKQHGSKPKPGRQA
jgi:hypothetical protein